MILSLNVYSQVRDDSTILWSSSERIKWSDFRGKCDSVHRTFNGRFSKALSATGLKFFVVENDSNQECYELRSLFYCYDSWKSVTSEALLDHERGHFDLTEVCARRLRKRLLRLSELGQSISLSRELDLALNWYDSISDKYDHQTRYGTDFPKQVHWGKEIAKSLSELSEFSDQAVICLYSRRKS